VAADRRSKEMRLIEAALSDRGWERRVVPPSMWPQIRRRLDGDDEPAEPVEEEEADVLDPADDAFEPDDDFDEFEH